MLTTRLIKQGLSSETRVVFNKPTLIELAAVISESRASVFDILINLMLDCFEQSLTSTSYKEFRL
ncbi:hypothetical protein [Methylobacter sp. YRD-M1]|uniref:hypothetical protein n=1 Tax=Methylobacter sp. YRD-M1 TaxID=2911520 RepID=UPI003FA3B154